MMNIFSKRSYQNICGVKSIMKSKIILHLKFIYFIIDILCKLIAFK